MRVLFFGLGGVGQRHLRNLKSLVPEAAIAAVRHSDRRFEITPSLDADRSVDIVTKFDITLYPDLDAAASFKPDFAIVATPSHTHGSLAIELLRRRIPVFLEKPITHDRDTYGRLRQAANEAAVPVMLGYMLRFNPSVRRFRNMLQEDVVGRIHSVHVVANTYMPGWHPYEDYRSLYAARRSMGGGVVLTNVHLIDLAVWLFGRPARLWCVGGTLSRYETDVEDVASALFECEIDGRHVPVALEMSFIQRPVCNEIAVRGEGGCLTWELAGNRITRDTAESQGVEAFAAPRHEWNQMFLDELSHFLDCLASGRRPESSLDDAAAGHEVALAMKDALASGRLATP